MKQTPGEKKETIMFNRHAHIYIYIYIHRAQSMIKNCQAFLWMNENLFDKTVNQLRLENKLPENVYRKV